VLERYQQLLQRETQLVQQLGTCDSTSSIAKNLGMDLLSVLNQKMIEIKSLVGDGGSNAAQIKESPPPSPQTKQTILEKSVVVLSVEEQPTGNVVANKTYSSTGIQ
jgi:hypothetical protein